MMTVSQLAMLTVVAVASLRSLPAMADYGLASILLYLIPAVVFLVPTALVAAELATGWKGGVYVWVREAFGNRIGFLAIWLQWIQNVVWYPIQIAFIAVSLSYVFGMGGLGNNGVYVAAVINRVVLGKHDGGVARRQSVRQGRVDFGTYRHAVSCVAAYRLRHYLAGDR